MPVQNLIDRIEQISESLTPSERMIGDWIVTDADRAAHETIYGMAREIGVAKSTVSKFVRKLGYLGFREFHSDLLRTDFDPRLSVVPDIKPDDPTNLILEKTISSAAHTVALVQETIDPARFNQALAIIHGSVRVGLFGFGLSSTVASMAAKQFSIASVNTLHDPDLHHQLSYAASLTEDDCALVVSHSGTSTDLMRIITILKEGDCPIIALTSNPDSALSKFADCLLLLPQNRMRSTPWTNMAGTVAQLTVVDALYQALLYMSGEEEIGNSRVIATAHRLHD